MDPLTIGALAATGIGGLANLIGGIGQPNPEEIQRKRIQDALAYINDLFSGMNFEARTAANANLRQVRQLGARQAAAAGYTGGAAPFTSPGEASISARLDTALENIRNSKGSAAAQVRLGQLDFPIINKPNAWQYLGTLFNTGGKVAATMGAINSMPGDTNYEFDSGLKRLTGQTALDGAKNRVGDVMSPYGFKKHGVAPADIYDMLVEP